MRILHKKLCLLMLLLISCHLNILAQGKIITGVILDKTGETVIGASVLVELLMVLSQMLMVTLLLTMFRKMLSYKLVSLVIKLRILL